MAKGDGGGWKFGLALLLAFVMLGGSVGGLYSAIRDGKKTVGVSIGLPGGPKVQLDSEKAVSVSGGGASVKFGGGAGLAVGRDTFLPSYEKNGDVSLEIAVPLFRFKGLEVGIVGGVAVANPRPPVDPKFIPTIESLTYGTFPLRDLSPTLGGRPFAGLGSKANLLASDRSWERPRDLMTLDQIMKSSLRVDPAK